MPSVRSPIHDAVSAPPLAAIDTPAPRIFLFSRALV